jgi:ribonuclease E
MINNGAVSRGQFGQMNTPAAITETAAPAVNNAYISQSPVKQEARETFEKDEKAHRPNQSQNPKKRKHKEQREHHSHAHEQQNQVQEENVQVSSRQEQPSRQEQRELKRQQKRQQPQEHQNQQQHQDAGHGNDTNALPRRDRNNQQRPNRPNRHRDQSVLNETAAATPETVANPQQIKVDVIDAPRAEPMNTALIVNIDQGQSEIVALNQQQANPVTKTETAPVAVEQTEVLEPVQTEQVATEVEEVTSTEAAPAPVKRASNDPRSRRRHRDSQSSPKAVVPKVVPSQIPTLAQYTMSSLIRHVYGEDCTILIEQFGLVTTFNRALQKFAEQYANTLVVETVAEEKRPVTRDAELPTQKQTEEVEPAPVLALTPPEAPATRVANDPRERRRLAKLAAEQAKEAHIAANTTAAPVESTESKEEVPETVVNIVADETVATTPAQQPLELDSTDVTPAEAAPVEASEPVTSTETAEVEIVAERFLKRLKLFKLLKKLSQLKQN